MDCSVIIPSYRTEFIDETILSIAKQTRRPKEVIIVYEPSDLCELKTNRGVAMSTSEAFIVLGDDDKLHPEFIEKTLRKMEDSNADIVYTGMEQFGENPGHHYPPGFKLENFKDSFGIYFTSLTRKSLWEKVGGYDPKAGPFFDWDFWWMCAEAGAKAEYLPEPLFQYRTHPGQDSTKLSKEMSKWSREYILDKHNKISQRPQRHI